MTPWPADAVTRRPVADLIPYARNTRVHGDVQVAEIAASIREWGFTVPVLVDEANSVIAGHGRLLAAHKLGLETVPVMTARGWTPAQIRAYRIADNKLTLNSAWNEEMLALELAELPDLAELMGFAQDEVDRLMAQLQRTQGLTDPDEAPPLPEEPETRRGDLWICGKHRLLCGDATKTEDVARLLGDVKPDIANCDPPYGISVVGGGKPFGKIGGGKPFGKIDGGNIIPSGTYAHIIGDDSTDTGINAFNILNDIGIPAVVMWGGNYFADQLPASRCWLVWDKENTGNFADAELAWTNQDAGVRLLRHQWNGLIKASERSEKRVHPTQKPVALAEWVIETLAPKARSLIDPFLGSGSSLIACERRLIDCYGMELSEGYVDVAVQRWEAFTGETATRHQNALGKLHWREG